MTTTPAAAVGELLRCALIAKLAVDLDDGALARRAAGQAAGHAHLVAGLALPDADAVEPHARVLDGMQLEELLRQLYPARVEPDDDELVDPHPADAA